MTIRFILNGEDVTADAEAGTRLIDLLRDRFSLLGSRRSCSIGCCGVCLVIFNGNVVKSCLIPVFTIQDSEIITIEGFSQTDGYQDIVLGFYKAGLENCGYCDTGKILAAEVLLGRNREPSKDEILSTFHGIKCRCTDPEELAEGVMAAAAYRSRRLHGRSS